MIKDIFPPLPSRPIFSTSDKKSRLLSEMQKHMDRFIALAKARLDAPDEPSDLTELYNETDTIIHLLTELALERKRSGDQPAAQPPIDGPLADVYDLFDKYGSIIRPLLPKDEDPINKNPNMISHVLEAYWLRLAADIAITRQIEPRYEQIIRDRLKWHCEHFAAHAILLGIWEPDIHTKDQDIRNALIVAAMIRAEKFAAIHAGSNI